MKKMLIIAGHGGNPYDPGAIGNGVKEADLTRDLAQHLVLVCRNLGMDIDLYCTDNNMVQTYKNGGAFPFQSYDCCLEIHFNASGQISEKKDGIVKGTMFYVHKNISDETKQLANNILNDLIALGSRKAWDGLVLATKQYDGGLLVQNRAYTAGCEHLLLETCFVSDIDDVAWYQKNRDAIVNTVAKNLLEYSGSSHDSSQPSLYVGMVCNVPSNDHLNVRSKPMDNSPLVSTWPQLSNGNLVEVLDEMSNDWKKVRIAFKAEGYVYGAYLTNVSERKYVAMVVNVPDGDKLNVRINPGNDEPLLKEWPYLGNGNLVDVLGEVGNGWVYILIAGKYHGYVYGTYLEQT